MYEGDVPNICEIDYWFKNTINTLKQTKNENGNAIEGAVFKRLISRLSLIHKVSKVIAFKAEVLLIIIQCF